jgi:signal peptidase I
MSFNLALILTLLTLVSGVVVLVNRFVWKIPADRKGDSALETLVEYSRSFFPVLLFVLVVRSFVFEPFRIPSGSMMPTLLQGDFIFVKKYAYGLRLPVTETQIIETGEPERGDVVVFRLPADPKINFIKRIVGLPGDEVVYDDGRLVINGELVNLEPAPEFSPREPRYIETLDEREHAILTRSVAFDRSALRYVVPDGHYFVMGDNRDNSNDSRGDVGMLPESHLVGEAVRIWMHMDGLSWPRWDRIGKKIQ